MADSMMWMDPDGQVITFSEENGYTVMIGRRGFLGAGWSLKTQELAGIAGDELLGVRSESRSISITVVIMGATRAQLLQRQDALAYALDPMRGDSVITMIRSDGLQLSQIVRAEGQIDYQGRDDYSESLGVRIPVRLRAMDPYWRGLDQVTTVEYAGGSGITWFPFPDLVLDPGGIMNDVMIQNPGNAIAWPVWSIYGPGTDIKIKNITTGKEFSFSSSLVLQRGDCVVVDTRPGYKTAKKGTLNCFPYLAGYPSLFPLKVGQNRVLISMNNANQYSQVVLRYQPLYIVAG